MSAWSVMEDPDLALRRAEAPADWALARALVEAYARGVGVDLAFQDFDAEIADLSAAYAPPGGVWLATRRAEGVGCIGLRALGDRVAELKRLYVVPAARGSGLGRRLIEAALEAAEAGGFRAVRLDTLPSMDTARALYASLGFRPISPYRRNPVPGAEFLELTLPRTAGVSRGSTR